jgi:hypothetical protein
MLQLGKNLPKKPDGPPTQHKYKQPHLDNQSQREKSDGEKTVSSPNIAGKTGYLPAEN